MIQTLSIFLLKDYIEIVFFSTLMYALSRWLLYDKTKKLIPSLYLYIIFLSSAHYYNFNTITFFLLLIFPGVIGIFILMHQETLQKNLIGLKNITVPLQNRQEWSDHIIKTVFQQCAHKKDIMCIIEKNDDLSPFIKTAFEIDASITADLLTILCQSTSYRADEMIWITSAGVIKGINSTWISTDTHYSSLFHEITRLHTLSHDALFFHVHAVTHNATIIMNGTIHKHYSITQLHHIIRTYDKTKSLEKKGLTHVQTRPHQTTPQTPA